MSGSGRIILRTMPVVLMTALMLLTNGRSVLAAPTIQGDLAVVAGYRVDNFDWNIAGDSSGHNPDILSELTWRDLKIYQLSLTGSAERVASDAAIFSPCMRTIVGYGRIVSGKNQDSDYFGDNRTLEFSRSNNSADAGSVIDLSLAGGGKFRFGDHRYTLAPLLGFSYYAQNFTITDGLQTLSDPSLFPGVPPPGPLPGLNSTYKADWYGPWLGLDATAVLTPGWTLRTGVEVHQVAYRAEADWNLRSDLARPFQHNGRGYGLIGRLGSDYVLTSRLELTLAAELRCFAIRDGTDWAYFNDGRAGATRLNEVNWDSKMLTAGVLYHF